VAGLQAPPLPGQRPPVAWKWPLPISTAALRFETRRSACGLIELVAGYSPAWHPLVKLNACIHLKPFSLGSWRQLRRPGQSPPWPLERRLPCPGTGRLSLAAAPKARLVALPSGWLEQAVGFRATIPSCTAATCRARPLRPRLLARGYLSPLQEQLAHTFAGLQRVPAALP
jgi:hypothetical protein